MEKAILQVRSLTKSFEKTLFENLSFAVPPGESVAITGPSGVGKSTLLHILAGLETPDAGEVFILDKNIHETCQDLIRNDHIGFVFQGFHLLEDYNVLENVLMPAIIKREKVSPNSKAYQRAMGLLTRVNMIDKKNASIKNLSGGEKQRIAIARALCNGPDLLLADEPTGNLDEDNSNIISSLLLHACKEFNKALVIVTHDTRLAKLCNRHLELRNKALETVV